MKGWHNESYRHSLASRGISTKMDLGLPGKEWIKTSSVGLCLTDELEKILMGADDVDDLNDLMKEHESKMARTRNVKLGGRDWGEYLVCDEAAEIMSYILKRKGIEHESIVGFSDTGDSHVWLRVDGYNYDPTEQGMHEGQIVESWNSISGDKIHDYKDPDLDEKEYWDNIDVMDGEEENARLVLRAL